ncbi:MAG: transposase [Opitutus sp.]|nr:transposase [Opitutus sp.]
MARKLRLEYPGAVYHVSSRGHGGAAIFRRDAMKTAFLQCLATSAEKAGWVVHAWCVLPDRYHVCLQTPQPNLVEGMHWLQASFAFRFNLDRRGRGPIFHGRYKAQPVAPESVGAVCHSIVLKPVQSGMVKTGSLAKWPWTSVPALVDPSRRPVGFSPMAALGDAGGLKDTAAGRKRYLAYLTTLQYNDAAKQKLQFVRMERGWVIGGRKFKQQLLTAHRRLGASIAKNPAGRRKIGQKVWANRLATYLAALKKTARDVRGDAKSAPWKVAVAATMKSGTTASNLWISQRLNMGSPFRLGFMVSQCRSDPATFQPYLYVLARCQV